MKSALKWGLAFVVVVLFFFAYKSGVFQYLTLESIQAQKSSYIEYYEQNKWLTMGAFFLIYIAVTALSFPGAALLTLLGGAIFGFWRGLLLISFASTIGATLAFLFTRLLLRESVQKKFSSYLSKFNQGIEKEGAFYLFSLRLIPIVPFFVINMVMGLTNMKTWTYFWVSQLGMLAGTAVYVNAGLQLSQLTSLSGIVSPKILLSFVLLGLFPFLAKKLVGFFKARKVLKGYKKPKKFDYNIVAIGAGAGGLVTSYIAAAAQAKVALIEKHKMGGDCLNTGCVPSKALIQSAKYAQMSRNYKKYGFDSCEAKFDFKKVMGRVHEKIKMIEPHDSVERYTKLGVDCKIGEAKILSPYEVEVNGEVLTTKNIVIATGARPNVPPIPGLKDVPFYTSDNLWDLKEQPKKLIVLGGGPIGIELAQAFLRLGSEVHLVERGKTILAREDSEVSDFYKGILEKEGMKLKLGHNVESVEKTASGISVKGTFEGQSFTIEGDTLLVALGRRANVSGFGLEELGVELTKQGTIEVDDYLRTNVPNIYACGDVCGPYQFTHFAAHQAWFTSVNAMISPFYGFKADYRVIPWCTYLDPEIARVGLNEKEANEKGIAYEVVRYGIDDLDRAITDSADYGWVKVLTEPGKDKILGVTIVGERAGDIISEFVTCMKYNLGLNKVLGTIHIYPTYSEANKYAAGEWKRKQVSEKTLSWARKFHSWRRS